MRYHLATNLYVPISVLSVLLKDSSSDVRLTAAANPALTTMLLDLMSSPDEYIRAGVAANPNTPVEMLTSLANDPTEPVRSGLAANPNTPPNILLSFATASVKIRERLVKNPSCPVNVLTRLASDPAWQIRYDVLKHSSTPLHVLIPLTFDENKVVRSATQRIRQDYLDEYVATLPSSEQTYARLLIPSFTGWPNDLAAVLKNLKTSTD